MTRHGTPVGDPGPFTCSFFTPLSTADFLGKPFAWWEVKSWRILHLCWRLFSGLGCFLSFLPNSPLWGPNRLLPGLGRVVPHLGWKPGTRGFLGANRGLGWFCGTVGCGWFSPVPEGTQGTQKSARGEGAKFASLARAFPRVQGGNAHQCTLQLTHNM